MSNVLLIILLTVGSYLFGSINFAVIISKFKKLDIKKMGSGNPGTLNMSRNLGLALGLLTFFLDIMKGVACTLVSYYLLKDRQFYGVFDVYEFGIYLSGLAVVLGHIYPFWMKFHGGKGIATTIGVFMVCESVHGWQWSIVAVMALVGAAMFIYFTEFGAMGSFIAITPPAISGSIRLYFAYGETTSSVALAFYIISNMLIFAICFFTWFAHRKNIERMLSGEEHPTSIKEMVIKAKMKKLEAKKASKTEQKNSQTNKRKEKIEKNNKVKEDKSNIALAKKTEKKEKNVDVKTNITSKKSTSTTNKNKANLKPAVKGKTDKQTSAKTTSKKPTTKNNTTSDKKASTSNVDKKVANKIKK